MQGRAASEIAVANQIEQRNREASDKAFEKGDKKHFKWREKLEES